MPIIRGVICDGCNLMLYWDASLSKQDATAGARRRGWSIGKKCLCPECRRGRKQREED